MEAKFRVKVEKREVARGAGMRIEGETTPEGAGLPTYVPHTTRGNSFAFLMADPEGGGPGIGLIATGKPM